MFCNRRDTRLSFGRHAGIAAVLLWVGAPAFAAPAPARQMFVVTDFDTVRLEAPIEVTVVTGKGASAVGTGDRATLDTLDLAVNGRTLTVRMHKDVSLGGSGEGGKPRLPTRIALTTGDLRRAIVSGVGILSADRLTGDRTEATVRGPGSLTLGRVATDRIDIGLLGAGSITLAGTALDMVATISGSGRLDAAALDARRLRIDTEGPADAKATAREEAVAAANGPGRLVIAGPAKCTVRKTGSASITCGGAVY